MAKYKLLSDELSRMAKVFVQFKEAQELVDSLASLEQGVEELSAKKASLSLEVEALKRDASTVKSMIEVMQEEAAEEATKAMSILEEKQASTLTLVNSMLADAKAEAEKIITKAQEKVRTLEIKEFNLEQKVKETESILYEKEDALEQVQTQINKLRGN